MTKIIIVDEKDNIIGSKERDKVKGEIYRVSALWLKNPKNQFLLARRAFSKTNNPGKWGPAVAGTVEEGESYEENIIKEAEEEIGLRNLKIKKGAKVYSGGKYKHFTQLYTTTTDKIDLDFNKEEIAEIKWFSNEEFLEQFNSHPEEFLENMKKYFELFQKD